MCGPCFHACQQVTHRGNKYASPLLNCAVPFPFPRKSNEPSTHPSRRISFRSNCACFQNSFDGSFRYHAFDLLRAAFALRHNSAVSLCGCFSADPSAPRLGNEAAGRRRFLFRSDLKPLESNRCMIIFSLSFLGEPVFRSMRRFGAARMYLPL